MDDGREYVHNDHLKQPGDPALAARAILTALDADEPPLRLVLASVTKPYHSRGLPSGILSITSVASTRSTG